MADVGVVKGMARKRERHFNETKTVLAVALMLFGACALFCLVVVYPQSYLIQIFNSKLSYHLIMDVEDYFTCNNEYQKFVIDEPDETESMFTFFVFNVSNPADVLQRGNMPAMVETGPYGFMRHTYKYDITFPDPKESTTVRFKEFTLLKPITDIDACSHMFYRMDRDNQQTNPCADCSCKSYDSLVTVINPLLLKLLKEETPTMVVARHAAEVFTEIKRVLEDPFTEAVKAHMVSIAYREVYLFRILMQAGQLVRIAVDSLQAQGYTIDDIIANGTVNATSCGLAPYSYSNCPMTPFQAMHLAKLTDLPYEDYPSIYPFLNVSERISALNRAFGMPHILGLSWYLGYGTFNDGADYSSITREEMAVVYNETADVLARRSFGNNYTPSQAMGSQRMVSAFVQFIESNFVQSSTLAATSFSTSVLKPFVVTEFRNESEPVACSPLPRMCLWTFGYLTRYENFPTVPTDALITQMIDSEYQTVNNPTNLYIDSNGPLWYNSFQYCTKVLPANASFDIDCTDLGYTLDDGLVTRPSAVWAKDNQINTDNLTLVARSYAQLSPELRQTYLYLACNISYLTQGVYRDRTDFHDHFVISFINKNKDARLNHTFAVGSWDDLGVAQFGGGFITQAVAQVRTTNMIVRDGMWRIGRDDYYENFIEYSSWCVKQGYPYAWIYNVSDARLLLHSLARRDAVGVSLRQHIAYQGTTFVGDGINTIRGVGEIGDLAFTTEANLNHFNCTGPNQEVCSLLDNFYASSEAQCSAIQTLFYACILSTNNRWLTPSQCYNFETSETSSSLGIQCDETGVYGNAHPYTKSMGNIVYEMMWSLTSELELKVGLWCSSEATCAFMDGGLFATTTVRKLLFNGYTEPSVLKYLTLKHEMDGIGFECETTPYDKCGVRLNKCVSPGVMLTLPNGDKKLLRSGNTSHEEFFAPHFVVVNGTGELLWPYASNASVVQHARETMAAQSTIQVFNPHWAAHPNWLSGTESFQKHYQCQKRTFSGMPDMFNSCYDTLYTGRDKLNNTLNLKILHGNDTVYPYVAGPAAVNGSTINNQYEPFLWPGFLKYRYDYLGISAGEEFMTMEAPTTFSKLLSMTYSLYQKTLVFEFQRQFLVQMPLKTELTNTFPVTALYMARRFVEDTDTWDPHRALGTSHDSYGMPFEMPIGMASLERYSGFPLFASTPHMYGNRKWGGIEYSLVTGTTYLPEAQRTYQDFDPVTGRALRSAMRQQINIRIEAGPIFPNIISSQTRCEVPTRTFAGSTGYGCFTYVPLFWYEDARTIDKQTFFRFFDHYYTRPARAKLLTSCGIAFGCVFLLLGSCLFVNEAYHRRKFKSRVYID